MTDPLRRVGGSGSWSRTDDPGEPSTGVPRVSIADEECAILAALATDRSVVEIGTGLGVSTRALASTAISVTTVDIDPWVHENVWPDLPINVATQANIDLLDPYFDMAFIDGDHSTSATAKDITDVARLCPNGIWVIHDGKAPQVAAAFDPMWTIIPTEHGLGVRWPPYHSYYR